MTKYDKAFKQRIYNKVAKHFLKQRCHAIAKDGKSCLYRGPRGAMCAIGALIPNSSYQPEMENKSFEDLTKNFKKLPKYFYSRTMREFLGDLQTAHDESHISTRSNARNRNELFAFLTAVGKDHNLDTSLLG